MCIPSCFHVMTVMACPTKPEVWAPSRRVTSFPSTFTETCHPMVVA